LLFAHLCIALVLGDVGAFDSVSVSLFPDLSLIADKPLALRDPFSRYGSTT